MAKQGNFVDQAFESDDDDPIRTYGTTSESRPLTPGKSPSNMSLKTRDADSITARSYKSVEEGGKESLINSEHHSPVQDPTAYHVRQSQRRFSSTCSTETSEGAKSIDSYASWLHHPKLREHWKFVVGSILLFLAGIGLFCGGVYAAAYTHSTAQSVVFFVLGTICFIPGVYHVVYIYMAMTNKPGYNLYHLPAFK
ncbi:PREDICTED: transmembrane protein 134-like [Priapulus caudatus]|uniref:Transmembrane protein 134-like n=1 Tax=Priapulus caudatus TaxID=37621 RepID=A0ABM1END7_PRICU|nr:PREDICTED: transmembrane protein 134-like [Priapulus caudatus]